MKDFFKKLKADKKMIDDMNSITEKFMKKCKSDTDAFIKKNNEFLEEDIVRINKAKQKITAITEENDIEGVKKAIDEMISISQDDTGKRAREELYFDQLENVTKS